jgi:hypothetical protein
MSLSGNLKTVSFSDILQLLATGKKSGVLEVNTSSRQKEVAFKNGNIIHASSLNTSEDLLGNMLLRRGKISKTDLERAINLHKQTGRQLGTTLVDMNLFAKEEIAECLKLQIEEIVYNLFAWKEGNFLFHEGVAPKNAPILVELNTMSVVMEGTRRIDEWIEIQKVIPPDDMLLGVSKAPKVKRDEITLSVEEFRVMAMINGERTLPELIQNSPYGEFVTCRSIYRLVVNNLIEVVGKREANTEEVADEEEEILTIMFYLFSNAFHKIRTIVEEQVGENNSTFSTFAAQYRTGVLSYFPGVDPKSDLLPSFDKFLTAVRSIPPHLRLYTLMSGLCAMLSEQLEHVFMMLGLGTFQTSLNAAKREISEPLAKKRDLVKKYALENEYFKSLKRAEKVVRMVRGE